MAKSSEEARVPPYGLWAKNLRKFGGPTGPGCATLPVVGRPWAYLASQIKRLLDAYTTIEFAVNVVAGP